MQYQLLGLLRVADGDREILLPRQKDRALLAFLLLHARETVSIDTLLDELWGERPPPTAKNSLQNSVSRLRKSLGADVLRTRPPGYMLDVAAADVDLERFVHLVEQSQRQAAPERASTLARALALWRGPALADLQFEPFALTEAARLGEMRSLAEEALVGAELELGRHIELIPRIEELISRNALREQPRGQLMVALYRSGRQAEALAAYQATRKALVDELGIEPGPTLRALEQAILRQDAALAGPGPAFAEAVRPVDLRERLATVTVLFVDVVSPEDLAAERYGSATTRAFHELRAATEYHGGTVERLAGDELLAVFGVPERHEDDALRAVRAAVQIGATMERFPQLEIRGALVTGEVVAPGPAVRQPVAGAPVTVARRLAAAGPRGEILADAPTVELVGDSALTAPVTPLTVRGRAAPVPVFRIGGVSGGGRRFPQTHTPLVGRAAELHALRQAFAEASAKRRTAVTAVLGDAGLGKTRLSIELARSLEGDAEIAVARSVAYGEGGTWLPLQELVQNSRGGLDALRLLDARAAETLAALLEGRTIPIADSFWSARRFIEALARDRPALVILDDLHWAAPSFLDFVEQLAAVPAPARVLVLCLARPELAEQRPNLSAFVLKPLSDAEGHELVDAEADVSLPGAVRRRIAELAEGNPLFAEQLLAYVREHGADALASVPPTVEALLASRLDRLDAEARATLQRAAVLGREFRQASVLQLSPPLEVPAVGRHLSDLARKGIIHTSRTSRERADGFRFHHALVRDVAYASIPREERAALHEGVAEWLDATGDAEDELVGFHLERAHRYRLQVAPNDPHTAGLAVAAGRRLGTAGVRAHQRGDSPAAASLLSRAVALLPVGDCVAEDLFCELATAQWSMDDAALATASLDRAREAARAQRDLRAELRARIELANLHVFTDTEGAGDELLELAHEAIPLFTQYDDARSLGRTWLHVGFVKGGVRRRNEEWRHAAEQALEFYRRTGWSSATCVGDLASALLLGPVPANAARTRCRQLLAESRDDRLARAHVLVALAGLEAMLRRFAQARRLVAEARSIYEEAGFMLAVTSRSDRNLGRIELLARRPAAAARVLRSCCETFERTGDRGSLATTAAELAEALFRGQHRDEAAKWAAVSEALATQEDLGAQCRWRGVKAKLLAAARDHSEALDLALEAVRIAGRTDATNEQAEALASLAHVFRYAGDANRADAAAEDALALFEQKENEAAAAQTRRFLGRVALPSHT